ncbi:MAG: hypothetical protein AB7N76_29005 [Planctomycetota bacterium]
MALREMPEVVKQLRGPWESQVERIKDLTWELEQEFRFGQRITKTDRGYVMGGTMKGGSSSMWYPAPREHYHAYQRWRNVEGLHEARDDEAYCALARLLEQHDVLLITRRKTSLHARRGKNDAFPFPGYGPLYKDMLPILRGLPAEHLSRRSLRRIQLGGWGPDAAKASAYEKDEASVLMYDFACRGARRTFVGLFLHELGHAHEVALSEPVKDALHQQYRVFVEHDGFFGVEFLVDPDTRKLYQKFVFEEFLAETYMIYVACGQGLRQQIKELRDPVRSAWERAYELFRDSFHGIEYE